MQNVGETEAKYHMNTGFFDVDLRDPPPEDLCCSISHQLMEDPVSVMDGHTFERREVEKWFLLRQEEQAEITCPRCGSPLENLTLVPNYSLKSIITKYKQEQIHSKQRTSPYCNKNKEAQEINCRSAPKNSVGEVASKADADYAINERYGVVSIYNYKKHPEWFGHCYILIECFDDDLAHFVGLYDVEIEILRKALLFAPVGYVRWINVKENKSGNYEALHQDKNFFESKHCSFSVRSEEALRVRSSIREDRDKLNNLISSGGAPVKFQVLGPKDSTGWLAKIFSKEDGGINSASWCMDKLNAGGCNIVASAKGKQVVKVNNLSNCLIQ